MTATETLILRNEQVSKRAGLSASAVSGALNALLADMFALYLKTKNFKWHLMGPPLRHYQLLLEEQAEQIFATSNSITERLRKIRGRILGSIGQIAADERLLDNGPHLGPLDMLAELREDNSQLTNAMRCAKSLCDAHDDDATATLLKMWIDEAERRVWLLWEATRTIEV